MNSSGFFPKNTILQSLGFLSLILTAISSDRAEASQLTVEWGIQLCEAVFIEEPTLQNTANAGMCLGVASGVARIMTLNCYSVADGAKPETYLSAEPPPSTRAAVQAFLNWAKDNPQSWGDDFNVGMMDAMALTFPCMALGK